MRATDAGSAQIASAAELMLDRLAELSAEVAAGVWSGVPSYSAVLLSQDDLTSYVADNLRVVLVALCEGDEVLDEGLTTARKLGVSRALQGVPVESLIRSYRTAERALSGAFTRYFRRLSDDFDVHQLGVRQIQGVFDQMENATVDAYRATQLQLSLPSDPTDTDLVGLLASGEGISAGDLERMVKPFGIVASHPHAAVAARPLNADGAAALGPIRHHLTSRLLETVQKPVLTGMVRDHLVLLVPTLQRTPGELAEALRRALAPSQCRYEVVAAIGSPSSSLGDVAGSCREATDSLEVAVVSGRSRSVVTYDEVLVEVLLSSNRPVAEHLVKTVLGAIEDQDHLIGTLEVYFASRQSTGATARDLVVHTNTVTYRLRRAMTLTGRDLQDTDDVVALQLALRARRMLRPAH